MSMIRTFLAVEVSRDVRRRAAKLVEQLSQSGADIKWVSHDNVHITLGFLGDVDERQIAELCHKAKTAIEGFESFEISCETVGAFPNTSNPRTIWMGVQDGAENAVPIAIRFGGCVGRGRVSAGNSQIPSAFDARTNKP